MYESGELIAQKAEKSLTSYLTICNTAVLLRVYNVTPPPDSQPPTADRQNIKELTHYER